MKIKTPLTLAALLCATSAFAMSSADANDDTMITISEMKAAHPEVSEDQFNEADANDDGVIDLEELTAAITAGVLPNIAE